MVLSAALGRHVLWVGHRQCEDATKAVVAHDMVAWKFGRLGGWRIAHTRYALHPRKATLVKTFRDRICLVTAHIFSGTRGEG